ncbi:MAG: putative transporter [Hoylesella marshii]|uniref:TrkA C-terminal domain protein n=1 Tax=Hoylesella marshii DSM 16973 = JCM 13450 TaxID=862515 RepID=E0NTS0_9BACT|nr:putative transporter [Hoylesella marshii]EFM01453.1 TrkA C-terminal domain protein [Hoylesella marshii DSM 16973 = JCM 13450]
MTWLEGLFSLHSSLQTIIILSLVCAVGLAAGKIRIFGVSLGIAFVFFIGILAGHLGLSIDAQMLDYAENFGLILFVYTLGLHVGPSFFSAFKHEGKEFNLWGVAVIVVGTLLALLLCQITSVGIPDMMGLLCGATTNTPALGAAQSALQHLGLPTGGAALGCAVTYPLGVVGVILAILLMRKLFVKPEDLEPKSDSNENDTFVGQFVAINPAIAGKTIAEISQMTHFKFIISRIWRDGQVIVPISSNHIHLNDSVLVVTTKDDAEAMTLLFGKRVEKDWNREQIDWNSIDSKVESRVLVISRTELNGKLLGQLQLRHTYGVNVSRVMRGDVKLLATPDLRLQYGDRVAVVGAPQDIDNVEGFLGNAVQTLNEPNLAAIFIGIILGLALGTIPISIPGMDVPVRLGIAGGPILVGILVGTFGPRFHLITYTTRSASLMLRKLGLSLYLACLGLEAGGGFFETVIRSEGLLWIGLGFLLTVVPVLIVGLIALKTRRMDYGTICGILCGSMANPMALSYANETIKGDSSSVSYATVYPLSMFIRVIIAQVIVMFFA